jgi:hypothetical protein
MLCDLDYSSFDPAAGDFAICGLSSRQEKGLAQRGYSLDVKSGQRTHSPSSDIARSGFVAAANVRVSSGQD